MKSIFLSVVVICALAIAGVGGTLANYSDTEMAADNVFATGDLDLQIADDTGTTQDDGFGENPFVPAVTGMFQVGDVTDGFYGAWPEEMYERVLSVRNAGSVDGILKIHFKEYTFENNDPSHAGAGYSRCDPAPCVAKSEPELVEEFGGWLDQEYQTGYGIRGDGGTSAQTLDNFVYVRVWFNGAWWDPSAFGTTMDSWILMSDIDCNWVELGTLAQCGECEDVYIQMKFLDLNDPNWSQDPQYAHHWTNSIMGDIMNFDINFGLVGPAATVLHPVPD